MSVKTKLTPITKTAARARYTAGQLVAFSDGPTTDMRPAPLRGLV
jgi:hypothetical protein